MSPGAPRTFVNLIHCILAAPAYMASVHIKSIIFEKPWVHRPRRKRITATSYFDARALMRGKSKHGTNVCTAASDDIHDLCSPTRNHAGLIRKHAPLLRRPTG